ncbi:hypothetical protein JCM33374_g3318 [Metschnikowia sp. JCM 33374]|nr:hypothetical protein JCM33374_g3318 [Metschnikowia sp. JCM 33374]
MGFVSYVFEAVSLVAFFGAFSSWSFRYVFNHEIIRNYSHRTHYAKAQINTILEHDLNAKYGCRFLRLEIDDDESEEDEKSHFSAQNPQGLSTFGAPSPSQHLPHRGVYEGVAHDHINASDLARADKTHLHYVVGVLFSIVVTLSCELVLILMIQLFASVDLNLAVFRLVISALVVLVTLVQPPLIILLYVNQGVSPSFNLKSPKSVFKLAVTGFFCAGWFLVLSKFGTIAHGLAPADSHKSFLEEKTNEIILAGITITALLSGVGCTSTPIRSFWVDGISSFKPAAKSTNRMEEVHLNELIQSYNSTKMLCKKRRTELNSLLVATGGKIYNAPENDTLRSIKGSGRHLLNRVQSFTSLSNLTGSPTEEDELRREISSLNELSDSIYSDLSKKLDQFLCTKKESPKSSVRFARLVTICQLLFSLYCIYRIFNVLFLRLPYHFFWSSTDLHRESNIIDDKDSSETLNKNTKDALAITIAKVIQGVFGYLPISETQLINQVSFILSGSLFACSFQNVLVTFKSLGRFLPANRATVNVNVKSWVKHLIVSEFMAIYVIATALLIRSNLPPDTAASMSRILSLSTTSGPTSTAQIHTEVEFIDTWFDKVFAASCVVTFVVIFIKLFIEHDSIYDGGYDEEMIIEDNSGLKLS